MIDVNIFKERLKTASCWIFDLDGTLTVPIHDFEDLRRRIGLQPGAPILKSIQEAAPDDARRMSHEVDLWEQSLVARSQASPGSLELLTLLKARQCPIGVLTRNRLPTAIKTLEIIGLSRFFQPEHVLGRDEATPKPSPAGLFHLMSQWGVSDGVMLGDYIHDMDAGRAADCLTVHIGPPPPIAWDESIDLYASSCEEVLTWLNADSIP